MGRKRTSITMSASCGTPYLKPNEYTVIDSVEAIESAKRNRQILRNKPRFLIATDFQSVAAFDVIDPPAPYAGERAGSRSRGMSRSRRAHS